MAKFKKSLLAIFVAIAAITRAAPVDKDKGAKRSRSPGLFSRQPPSGSRLPTTHISIGQPPNGLSAISPGPPPNAPVQRRNPEPEDEDDLDVRSVLSGLPSVLNDVSNVVSDAGSFVAKAGSIISNVVSGVGYVDNVEARGPTDTIGTPPPGDEDDFDARSVLSDVASSVSGVVSNVVMNADTIVSGVIPLLSNVHLPPPLGDLSTPAA